MYLQENPHFPDFNLLRQFVSGLYAGLRAHLPKPNFARKSRGRLGKMRAQITRTTGQNARANSADDSFASCA
jgi:hypothetical protein